MESSSQSEALLETFGLSLEVILHEIVSDAVGHGGGDVRISMPERYSDQPCVSQSLYVQIIEQGLDVRPQPFAFGLRVMRIFS